MAIDNIKTMTTLLLTPKSEAVLKAAGGAMDEERQEMKTKDETTKVITHLRRSGQLHRDKEFKYYRLCR